MARASKAGLYTGNNTDPSNSLANKVPRILKRILTVTDPDGSRSFIDPSTGATLKIIPNGDKFFGLVAENFKVDAQDIIDNNKDSIIREGSGVVNDENSLVNIRNLHVGLKSILNQAIDSNNVQNDAPRP